MSRPRGDSTQTFLLRAPSFLPNPNEVDRAQSKKWPFAVCLDWLLGNRLGRLLAFAGLGITQVIVGAYLWRWRKGDSWQVSFWTSWSLFIDTGTQTGEDAANETLSGLLITAGLSVAGWIYNMTLLGLVLEGVKGVLDGWREERNRLFRTPDVALLCFNEKTLHYLKQLMYRMRKDWRRHQVVILADMDSVEMERKVLSHLGPMLKSHGVKVHCRRGSPYELDHLQRSEFGSAKEIVLLSHSDDDASILRRITTMGALPEGIRGHVYVDICSQEAALALQTILPGTTIIRSHRMSMRLLCLLATDPALAASLLELDRRLVVVQATAAMDGLRFAALGAQEWFDASLCIGVRSARGGNVILNPPGGTKIRQGDSLLVVGGTGGTGAGERLCQKELALREKHARDMEENPDEHVALCGTVNLIRESGHGYARHSKTIIILGWPVDADYMLEVIDSCAPLGATVHVLCKKPIVEREADVEECPPLQNIKLVHHVGNRLLCKDLSALPISSADSIVVLSRELQVDETCSASDSECLLCAVMVMGIFEGRWGPSEQATQAEESDLCGQACIICEMLSPDSERTFLQNVGLKSRCLLFRSHAYEASMIASRMTSKVSFVAHRQMLQAGLFGELAEGGVQLGKLLSDYRGKHNDGPLLVCWQDDFSGGISVASASSLRLPVGRNKMAFFLPGQDAWAGRSRGRSGSRHKTICDQQDVEALISAANQTVVRWASESSDDSSADDDHADGSESNGSDGGGCKRCFCLACCCD